MKTSPRLGRVQPSATLAITSKAKALKAAGRDVIGFGAGEPDFATPTPIVESAKAALDAGRTTYAPTPGLPELRSGIAAWYNQRYGTAITADHVMVSVGGKHALYNVAMALLAPGDKVLIPSPYWVSYPAQVLLADGEPVFVETTEDDGFAPTAASLEAAIQAHKPRYVILNSPSNPTGMAIDRERLASLLDVIRKHPGVALVWDSIYEQITYGGFEHTEPLVLAPDLANRIITVSGFSKAYAMTGWRLGYTIADPAFIKSMVKLQSHCTSGATTFAMAGATAALTLDPSVVSGMIDTFGQRRARMIELLEAIPDVTVPHPQGAFYAFPNLSAYLGGSADGVELTDDHALAGWLLETAGVAVVPGSAFGAPGYVRLSYATSMDQIEAGLERMTAALASLRG